MSKKIAFILAGGRGERLWPLSRENFPKQFVEFERGYSLFQLTLKRVNACFSLSSIYIVSSSNYKFTIYTQIEALDFLSRRQKEKLKKNLIIEPVSKNTAPATLLGLKYLGDKISDKDIVYVFPSDHYISPLSKFKTSLRKAENVARKNLIVVFGVKPNTPQEGYGYILAIKDKVKKFIEKPPKVLARRLIQKGAFWNCGIFCFKKATLLDEFERYNPLMHKFYNLSLEDFIKNFSKIPSDSIDYALIQKAKRVGFVKFEAEWSDLGNWESFLEFYSQDKRNYIVGEAQLLDCQNCLVFSPYRLVSLIGMKDSLVIDSLDTLLIIKKGLSSKVKDLVKILRRKKKNLVKESLTVYRPWGYYTVLKETSSYKVKEIGIYPKKYISLQRHKFRSEHWNVVEGRAEITLGGEKFIVKRNQSIYVKPFLKHKVYNPTNKLLKIIEVQIGSYLGEDDIQRFDAY